MDQISTQIALSLWRSGYVKDRNKVRQAARQKMRVLIANDLSATLEQVIPGFDKTAFLQACSLN